MASELTLRFTKRFAGGPVIQADLRLPAEGASVTVLFGPSAAGKTTVLRCLAGLERPEEGTIRFGDEAWLDAAAGQWTPAQERGVGLLFQEYALFPHLTVAGNVGFGLGARLSPADRTRVADLLRLFGLDDVADKRPAELSGGQRQRVGLARALAPRPRLLLLDEPLSALDAPSRDRLRGELRRQLLAAGIPSIVVTHDRREALALGDRIAVLAGGRIRQAGPVEDVFSRPADLEVAEVVGVETVVAGHVVGADGGLATVDVGGVTIVAVDGGGAHGAVLVCVRAEDVLLERARRGELSARNQLSGRVVSLDPDGPLVRVTIDCGFNLAALVTRQAAEEMHLVPGSPITAIVKAPSVHLIDRESA